MGQLQKLVAHYIIIALETNEASNKLFIISYVYIMKNYR